MDLATYDSPEYLAWCEEQDAIHEGELVNGVTGPCESCGEFSVVTRYVTTLGYPGHPGHEQSALYECVNPECQHADLAG